MKIMLDCSPKKIHEYRKRYNHDFWQLRTPLTRYSLSGLPYGLDNGCFSEFKHKEWERLLLDAEVHRPKFVCLPDVVGDAARTLDLFAAFERQTNGLPRALVLQDGIGNHRIDFSKLAAVFVGGSDAFKISPECLNACRAAKMLGKYIHVGRVNSYDRALAFKDIADSCDGSGMSRFDERLETVLDALKDDAKPQLELVI